MLRCAAAVAAAAEEEEKEEEVVEEEEVGEEDEGATVSVLAMHCRESSSTCSAWRLCTLWTMSHASELAKKADAWARSAVGMWAGIAVSNSTTRDRGSPL